MPSAPRRTFRQLVALAGFDTIGEFARSCGIDTNTLSKVNRGYVPAARVLGIIAKALKVTTDALLDAIDASRQQLIARSAVS